MLNLILVLAVLTEDIVIKNNMHSLVNIAEIRRLAMLSNTTERFKRDRKIKRTFTESPVRFNKLRRRNQRTIRAIKEGEYQESNTLDTPAE